MQLPARRYKVLDLLLYFEVNPGAYWSLCLKPPRDRAECQVMQNAVDAVFWEHPIRGGTLSALRMARVKEQTAVAAAEAAAAGHPRLASALRLKLAALEM